MNQVVLEELKANFRSLSLEEKRLVLREMLDDVLFSQGSDGFSETEKKVWQQIQNEAQAIGQQITNQNLDELTEKEKMKLALNA